VVGAAAVSTAAAFGPADQVQPYADGSVVMPPGVAQTFAVERTGRLDGFTLTSPSGAPLFLQVYNVRADDTPDLSRPLLARNAAIQLRPGVTTDISVAPIPVRAGSKLAVALGTIRSTASRGSRRRQERPLSRRTALPGQRRVYVQACRRHRPDLRDPREPL